MDQTNRAGLTNVQNCRRVFDTLLGMYPPGHDIHEWLAVETVKWGRLGDALFDIGKFLKSQQKRSPQVLDMKLLRLWCRWEDAFPGKGFNKFHGMFCAVRRFVHTYEMAGRVSEESGEAYNGTQADLKGMLSSMPCDERRIEKITERAQGNLKGEVLKCRVMIDNKSKGKRRGPYRKKARVTGDRSILSRETKTMEVDGESYMVLGSGNLLPTDWFDIFEWFQGGRHRQIG